MSLSRGIGLLGESLITPRLSETRSQIYFFISETGWEFVPSEDLDEAPKFFCSWGVPMSGVSFLSFQLLFPSFYE